MTQREKNIGLSFIALLLLSVSMNALAYSGRTVEPSDLAGTWWPARGFDKVETDVDEMNDREIALEISNDQSAVMTRRFEDGDFEKVTSSSFQQVGSLFYWTFERQGGLQYQLVLGGWRVKSGTKIIFGHLYLSNPEDGLFNGWPVGLGFKDKN